MSATSVTDRADWRDFCARAAADLSLLDLDPPDPVMADVLGGNKRWVEARYAAIARDIHDAFPGMYLASVVELGAGYGGLGARLVTDFCSHYSTIDLPEAVALQRAYLRSCGVQLGRFDSYRRHGLAVSNYALSELRRDLQLQYAATLYEACDRGYITWNGFTTGAVALDELLALWSGATVRDAVQPTHPECIVLTWDRT